MTAQIPDETKTPSGAPTAEAVADYLRANPDFFVVYPDVLRDIEISHTSGDAISLLERQILALREENAKIKSHFDQLVSLAKSNDDLIKKIHQLALGLMEAVGPEAIFATLRKSLQENFSADESRVLIFARASAIDSSNLAEFVGSDWTGRQLFSSIIESGMPTCGALAEEIQTEVFGGSQKLASAAVLPLIGKGWTGALLICSKDENRFDASMGTEFLAYLGDIVALIIDPWIARN